MCTCLSPFCLSPFCLSFSAPAHRLSLLSFLLVCVGGGVQNMSHLAFVDAVASHFAPHALRPFAISNGERERESVCVCVCVCACVLGVTPSVGTPLTHYCSSSILARVSAESIPKWKRKRLQLTFFKLLVALARRKVPLCLCLSEFESVSVSVSVCLCLCLRALQSCCCTSFGDSQPLVLPLCASV